MTDPNSSSSPDVVPAPPHVLQAKEAIHRTIPAPQQQEVTLDRIIEVAEPLVKLYFDAQLTQQERELEYESKVLEHDSKRQRNVVLAFTVIIASVLIFAGYLISAGRDAVALDLIKLVAALGSVGFGGYGVALTRRKRDIDRDD